MENQEIGSNMSTRDIEGEWRAASYFLAKGPSASLQYLQQDVRPQLYALKAQVLDGDSSWPRRIHGYGSVTQDQTGSVERAEWDVRRGRQEEVCGFTVRDTARMEEMECRSRTKAKQSG